MGLRRFAIALGLALAAAGAWRAPARAGGDDPAFVALGLGYFDVAQGEDGAVDFRLEYRHDRRLWIFKPWVGIEATSDGAVYGAGGVLIDVYLGRRVVVTPSFGVGGYAQGDGKDLGSTVEFRSQIEAAYRFDDRSRLGLAFGHISNASLGDRNPGTEILNVYYSIPLTAILGE
ncbi:MAG: acyloxyacyl hydrolase [Kiloniellaceae bacterium]